MNQLRPMLSRLAATVLVLLALVGTAHGEPRTAPAKPKSSSQQVHIVTLGDSITKGARRGVTDKQTFASLIEVALRDSGQSVRVTNVGIGGERTDQALKRLGRILELRPDVVTIMYGTNDSYVDTGKTDSRISCEQYRDNLVRLVTELLGRGITPVLMTEPRWADDAKPNGVGEHPNVRLEKYVEACREVAALWRVPLVDHFAGWSKARKDGVTLRDWTTDGCHPNPAGHIVLANTMLPVLELPLAHSSRIRQRMTSSRRPIRVVCFGDSVTGVYYHTGSQRAYTAMLELALERALPGTRVDATNAGISGHTTADGLARIDKDVLAHKPDIVTVMFGLNDMVRVSLADYRKNLVTIVTRCRAIGAEVVLATPNNVIETPRRPSRKLVEYCDVVREVSRELKVPLCDSFRGFDAARHHDRADWRLLMSDQIHPNMDGHRLIATQLARTITGRGVDLSSVHPTQPAISRTLSLLKAGKPIRVLAMPPYDKSIVAVLKTLKPEARVEVTRWETEGLSLQQIEQDAARRVRPMKPDLVLIAVPRTAAADSREDFIHSYSWIMNHSLSFSHRQWDCVVIHPSVAAVADVAEARQDALVRRLVRAQDLHLVGRPKDSRAGPTEILQEWLGLQLKLQSK
jgi:lysophospholipase L1-like esterase